MLMVVLTPENTLNGNLEKKQFVTIVIVLTPNKSVNKSIYRKAIFNQSFFFHSLRKNALEGFRKTAFCNLIGCSHS